MCEDFDLFTVLFLQQILFPNTLARLEPGRTSQVSFRFLHVHLLLPASPDLTIYFKIFLLNEHYTQITVEKRNTKLYPFTFRSYLSAMIPLFFQPGFSSQFLRLLRFFSSHLTLLMMISNTKLLVPSHDS